MAFILAGVIFVITIVITAITAMGNMMSDNPSDNNSGGFIIVFITGTAISAAFAASHWIHIGW